MTPRTRTSNKDANYEAYYAKKAPRQVHFPHRRKLVRRPVPSVQDEKKQMKFLPERMKQGSLQDQQDSEEQETEEEQTVQETTVGTDTPVNGRGCKKRRSDDLQGDLVSDDEPLVTSSKRQRRIAAVNEEPSRTLRRQSTMTQFADGRRPSFGDDEPDFRPANRRSRRSWGVSGTEGEKDKKQRTLTQMVPGMGRLSKEELEELGDLDADLDDNEADANNVSQALIEQGLLDIDESAPPVEGQGYPVKSQEEKEASQLATLQTQSSTIAQSVEVIQEPDDEDDYQPTQFIEAPTLRVRQNPRRVTAQQESNKASGSHKSVKSRFGLLSTPEKRRVFEIPSSQSPAESVLSTQVSPQKSNRSVLRERTNNMTLVPETPSKCRQVTFREPSAQPVPPARLRKFESTIQDSEDEESDLEQETNDRDNTGETRQSVHGHAIGADTQAVLDRIDRACADEGQGSQSDRGESPDETVEANIRQRPYQSSPELGESWAPVLYDDDGPEFGSYRSSRSGAKSQSTRNMGVSNESLPILESNVAVSQLDLTEATQAHATVNEVPSTPPAMCLHLDDDLPSTPMVIRDESSDEEQPGLEPTPKSRRPRIDDKPPSTLVHQSTDLDGEPVQVPRSPSADHETQHSHSSKAEQQIQHEWLSYSQYVHGRAPDSSSMHATTDPFSYRATTQVAKKRALVSSSARMQHSQATTVDEVTPKKNRIQRVASAHTTPQRNSKSQPFISPEKPPSLFIPSSFPSPSKTAMEGWSSPVAPRTQNMYGSSQVLGSLEDFSIPLPPPIEDD
ncbi:hypothetical protein E8E13_003332 [Curvularia kusanoi]|uniref:Uncharacterized protein n=1 Tax=Curvularia kusanoi TaxID=90978 RepID=A0A9P4TIX2_CURKU|nr:hypothetical protein E8E13_003332 [Curvularia kusanoi]